MVKHKRTDPCQTLPKTDQQDRFFNIDDQLIVHCKSDVKRIDKYRLYHVYNKQNFDDFSKNNTQLEVLMHNPSFDNDIKNYEKQLKKKNKEKDLKT